MARLEHLAIYDVVARLEGVEVKKNIH
jgi:hypothetical protein